MNILLKQVTITDPQSPFNGKEYDLLIENGSITKIGTSLTDKASTIVAEDGLSVSPGWIDIFAHFGEPGQEYKESFETGAAAAAAGGYTGVFTLPNNKPISDNKSLISYAAKQSANLPIHIYPIGAITKQTEGKELAEMYDMRDGGAVAFSDALNPIQSPGLLLKALQYVKAFDGVLIQVPIDKSIGTAGLMNEGIISTRLGLPGIPALAEEIVVKRDIDLLAYTGSKLHITGVSTAASIELIKTAKQKGLSITCSVTPYHLFFCDEDLQTYDTFLKVNPPLRTKADMLALREAVADGTIDCIATHHLPQDWDHKICEFEYALFGMTGLETAFAVVNHLIDNLSNDQLVRLFSLNARNIFNLPATHINENQIAELTIYTRAGNSIFEKDTFKSKSHNSAFAGRELKGAVYGTIKNGKLYTN
jgi:dihydroorotase